jgi:hypothetical protein
VPAEKFLAEVEAVVLDSILAKLSKAVGANGGRYGLAGIDAAMRFYILWRYTYGSAELDAGEAIVFANGTHGTRKGDILLFWPRFTLLSAQIGPLAEWKQR